MLKTDILDKNTTVYILDGSQLSKYKIIRIIERVFKYFRDDSNNILCCTGDTEIDVSAWAVSLSEDDAYRVAIVYLINTLELSKEINNNTDILFEYKYIEENHADLILKYTDNIIVSKG